MAPVIFVDEGWLGMTVQVVNSPGQVLQGAVMVTALVTLIDAGWLVGEDWLGIIVQVVDPPGQVLQGAVLVIGPTGVVAFAGAVIDEELSVTVIT